MSRCAICGNIYDINYVKCPFCGHFQTSHVSTIEKKHNKILKINVKIDMPTVSEAIRLAKHKLADASRNKVAVVKLVHGYGSTGKGGKIHIALREELIKMKNIGMVKDVIPGEVFTPKHCKQLIRRFPELKKDDDCNRGNKGITLIEL